MTSQEQELQKLRNQLKKAQQAGKKQNEHMSDLVKEVQQLHTLLNLSNEIILVLNEAGLCRQVSSSLSRQLGYATREVLGHKLSGLIHPEDLPQLETTFLAVLAEPGLELPPVELRLQHKSGEWRYFEVAFANLLAGAHTGGIVLSGQDITVRKQLEEKLAMTQRFLLDFDDKLRPLTTEAALWDTAISQLQSHFKLAGCYFIEVPDSEDSGQLMLHPPAIRQALVENSESADAFNALAAMLLEASEQGGPVALEDARNHPLTVRRGAKTAASSMLLVPLFKEAQLSLAVLIELTGPGSFPPDNLPLLQGLLQHLWLSVQNIRLYRRGQQAAVLEERVRLARDLHDSLQQNLYAIQLSVDTALAMLKPGLDPARQHLQTALEYSLSSKTELHSLIFDLRPATLENQGLVAGLQYQLTAIQNGGNLEVVSNLAAEPPVSIEVKEALYWIGREALHNIVKHSHATRLELILDWDEPHGQVRLSVADNGRGFNPAEPFPGHLGLQSMRERATRLGGITNISSVPGTGTCIEVVFTAWAKI